MMKRKCFWALLFVFSYVAISLAVQQVAWSAIDIYVAPSGLDTAGDGSMENPYRSLAYAVSIASSGQTVGLFDGAYPEVSIAIPPGVSITSLSQDASKVTIYPKVALPPGEPLLKIESHELSAPGNQSISYITLDGTLGSGNAARGIMIKNRNDVHIHHCTIKNFTGNKYCGGVFVFSTKITTPEAPNVTIFWPHDPGSLGDDSSIDAGLQKPWPTNPVERFELDHCNIINCGNDAIPEPENRGYGCITLFIVKDSKIHHNLLDNSSINDRCIKGGGGCAAFLWNVDVYENTMRMKQGQAYESYIVETWLHRGGCEFYNNNANGCFSIVYGKQTEIRNNILMPYLPEPISGGGNLGIEFTHQSFGIVSSNYIDVYSPGSCIGVGASSPTFWHIVKDTLVATNICVGPAGFGITMKCDGGEKSLVDGWKFYNNTIISKGKMRWDGIRFNVNKGQFINVEVVNNIVIGAGRFGGSTIVQDGANYSSKRISNNLFYANQYNSWEGDYLAQNIIVQDPKFVGGTGADAYKLRSDSPAIGAGVPVPLTYDFAGNPFSISHPSIGAYEYNETVILPPENVKATPRL